MHKSIFKKNWPIVIAVLSLVAALGLTILAASIPAAFAQGNGSTVYFPLIYKNAAVRPEESIAILTPASGSVVTSTIHIEGISDPTFEQNLVVRVLTADGTEVAEVPTTIQVGTGQRGPFALDLPVNLTTQQNIFVQVFAASPRDGGVTHLSSVGVTFTPTGPANIITRAPYQEQIAIFQPQITATVTGGNVQVSGYGLASFEQTLLVQVLDEDGMVVGSQPVMVDSAGPGKPGPFQVNIPYTVSASGPGRIVVRDVSPAFGGDVHLSSVEVTLAP
jgi:hypothetical protein